MRFPGYGIYHHEFDEARLTVTLWVRQISRHPTYTCGKCGVERSDIGGCKERQPIRDLSWGPWRVYLVVEVHRINCRACGVTTERIPFLAGKHPYTKRFCKAVARDCEDASARRVAAKWTLSHQTVSRIDKEALKTWSRGRKRRPLRQMGIDEVFWKSGRCITIVSNLETGEPIWSGDSRKRETIDGFFRQHLRGPRRQLVKAVCIDMWQPFIDSVKQHLPHAAIVFDKFHIMQYANRAVDETRRHEFFRRGGTLRAAVRGKRWLFLRRWDKLGADERVELGEVLRLNRPLMKAHILREQLDHLWEYTYEGAARRYFNNWVLSIRWQRLPAFKKLVGTLTRHLDGILAYCHHKVPFGVVEAINGNIRGVLRRGRGYTDHRYLILKVQRATYQIHREREQRAA